MSDIIAITTVGELDTLVANCAASGRLLVVKFGATWCGPCERIKPEYKKMAEKYGAAVQFVCVDYDSAKALAAKHAVEQFPTFHYWKHGKCVARIEDSDPVPIENMVIGLMRGSKS
jgi:thioredoxin 1